MKSVPAMAVLLAACAGATDVFAFFGLGKAFAGVITGNLVTVGYGAAVGDTTLIRPAAIAVAGVIIGEITWAMLLRLPRAADWLLVAEIVLFLIVLTGWLTAGEHPGTVLTLILLALVSVALGGQSIWALRIHQTTTYFTGMLTNTIDAAAGGSKASIGRSIRQLAALFAGAIASGVILHVLRPATPIVPLLLLAAATTVHLRFRHPGGPGRPAPAPPTSEAADGVADVGPSTPGPGRHHDDDHPVATRKKGAGNGNYGR
jgi:uncharacterized membrane protein YoaK (UPF0700 family)